MSFPGLYSEESEIFESPLKTAYRNKMEYTFADMYKDSPKSIGKNNLLWCKNNGLHLLQSKNTKKRRTSSNRKQLRTENIKNLQPIPKNSTCGERGFVGET